MERPIKVNFPHQTKLDEINDKLWTDFEIVESYKQMWQNSIANHISRKERDELSDQLQEKLDKFHYDFLYGCQQIIEDITSQYVGSYKTKEILSKLEHELESNLMNFLSNWKQYISSTKALKLLLDIVPDYDLPKLRWSNGTFIEDNYNDEITINNGILWRTIFNILGISNFEISKHIDKKFNLDNLQ